MRDIDVFAPVSRAYDILFCLSEGMYLVIFFHQPVIRFKLIHDEVTCAIFFSKVDTYPEKNLP